MYSEHLKHILLVLEPEGQMVNKYLWDNMNHNVQKYRNEKTILPLFPCPKQDLPPNAHILKPCLITSLRPTSMNINLVIAIHHQSV